MTLAQIQEMRTTVRAKMEDLIGRTGEREMSTEEKQMMADLTAEGQRLNSLAGRYQALEDLDKGAPANPAVRFPVTASRVEGRMAEIDFAFRNGKFRDGKQATDIPLQIQQSPVSGAAGAVRTDVLDQAIDMIPVIDVPSQLGVTDYPRDSTNPLVVTFQTGAPAAATKVEGTAPTESDPGTYLTKTLTGLRYANLTKVSIEAIANVAFPLVASVVRGLSIGQIQSQNTAFAAALKAKFQANHYCFVEGGGSDPHSVLSRLICGLPALWQNRPQNQFLLNSTDLLTCLDARDSQHRPLLDLSAGKLMGKPYVVSDDVDRIYYGDFGAAAFRSRTPLYVQVLRELYAQSGMVGYSAYQFADFGFAAELTTLQKQPVVFSDLSVAGS